jgi:2-polyprenyl-3-methyl-5-hydroxy-6-metoxy-1,4-benzoquinol methylase
MANHLTDAINLFLNESETVIDFCCGNGVVSDGFLCSSITGVDAYRPYLNEYINRVPNSSAIELDLNNYNALCEKIANKSFDTVICADGVEHLKPDESIRLIEKFEQIARKNIIIFTPLNVNDPGGIVLNSPHNAWDVEGGDDWQIHRCGYSTDFFILRGYQAYSLGIHPNVYDGTPYGEILYVKNLP